ncbi:MAG: DASS family sodium-coupled anion symporter [Calditrichaeota bacterium]|nr:DASS family sodium-coupled anion symporter [Calditrichota bacterium]
MLKNRLPQNKTKLIKTSLLFVGLTVGILTILLSPPADLSPAGMDALGIAIICVTLWVLAPIPLAATSLIAMVLLSAMKILDSETVFAFFGNSAVFFLLGVFILAGAMIHTGLSKRLSLFFLSKFDKSPRAVLFGILFTSSFLSFFMPSHAVAAMMFPVILEVAQSLELKKGASPFATGMFVSLAWGSVIGGTATFLGGARAPLAVEFLKTTFQKEISFTSWALSAAPISIVLTFVAFFIITSFFKPEINDVGRARILLQQELVRIGKISKNELKIGLLVLITVLFWIFGGNEIGLAVISLAAAVMVFVLDIAEWLEVSDYVNWGVIVMYGGAIALGKALSQTHAIDWLARQLINSATISPFLLILLLAVLTKVITELISNAAAVVVLIPFSFGFVSTMNIAPEILVLAITIPAGLAFCLPIGTPPNAIAFSSGYFSVKNILKPALLLSFVSLVIFLLFVKFYLPLIM